MIVKAIARFIRISPNKTRQVINLIRHKDALQAYSILANIDRRPRFPLKKVLDSAIANAKVKGFKPEQLYISKIVCDQAGMLKRYRAAAFGRAAMIQRRLSHIRIELDIKTK